ncbi:MAG: hypothetical protein M1828_005668 [Chrysothrix sp. TS-e1954]|nr:MAG: hypothetical protein M1828_005668 [Chrysothrix sp. TS-e1954]
MLICPECGAGAVRQSSKALRRLYKTQNGLSKKQPAQHRLYSSIPPSSLTINGTTYQTDSHTNIPPNILTYLPKKLHLQPHHPISLTRQLIESRFPTFKTYNDLSPIVSVHQNFDSLATPPDHISRSKTDTYYINRSTLLRTHTSAHEADIFRANESSGYLISADVYRRDAVDKTHYPVFHQLEGARVWDRRKQDSANVAKAVWEDLEKLPRHELIVSDPNPTVHPQTNPLQPEHTLEEAEAISTHLKRSIENVVVEIFSRARLAALASSTAAAAATNEPLQVRWVPAYFPFTSPSWELEVHWQGQWLEVLGCGVSLHRLLAHAGQPTQLAWAFGMGLERIAMLLFDIPDIRLFWSEDARFLGQFREGLAEGGMRRFVPFSKHPACYKDVSFWVPEREREGAAAEGRGGVGFHENDLMEIVRMVAGNLVEDVRLVDEFKHPRKRRESKCYRINYRSMDKTLENEQINQLHLDICNRLTQDMGVEIR